MMAARWSGPTLALSRVAAGGLMLAKSVPMLLSGHGPAGPALILGLAMTVIGLAVVLGLATRVAGLLGALLMTVIYCLFHAPVAASPVDNGGVPAILSACIFLHLAAVGPGIYSLDGWRAGRGTGGQGA